MEMCGTTHKAFTPLALHPSDNEIPSRSLNRYFPLVRKVLSKGRYTRIVEESERGYRYTNALLYLLKSVIDRYQQVQKEAGVFHFYSPPVQALQARLHFSKTSTVVE